MRTLHAGLRVNDLDRSLAFYTAVGYQVLGSVPETAFGSLIELVQWPDGHPAGMTDADLSPDD